MELFSDTYFMEQALQLARIAYDEDEIPVGAVIVANQRIIAKAYNQTERLQDVTAHAEMLAITAAAEFLGGKYLIDCTLYVTLEPCPMCAGALQWSQISRIVYAASDPKRGYTRYQPPLTHPKTLITRAVLANESETLLQSFFQKRRSS